MQSASAVPLMLGIAGAVSSGAGTASTIMAGMQESAVAKQNAKIAEENARLAMVDAGISDVITANRVADIRDTVTGQQAQVESAAAARGLVTDTGSLLQLSNEMELEAERQVLQENIIGNRESQGLRSEARSLLFQSKLHKFQGKQAKQAAIFGGVQGFFAQSSALLPMFAKQPQQRLGTPASSFGPYGRNFNFPNVNADNIE